MVFLTEVSSDTSSEESGDVCEPNATQEKVPQVFETSAPDLIRRSSFRVQYFKKLAQQKAWVPKAQRTPNHQTVVIFDWDDTLLPTSYLNSLDSRSVRESAVLQDLQLIEEAGISLLESGLRLGHVFIITNAVKGWVEQTAATWMPGILPMLRQVPVISARSNHEAQHPGDVAQWKKQAFLDLQRQLHSDVITNLLSVGDSNFELEAVHAMGKAFATSLVKTVKLKENPTALELAKQLALVRRMLEKIAEAAQNMNVQLARKN